MKTTSKKNLDEILNKSSYSRLTSSLKERTEEIAGLIRRKMDELDIINDADFDEGEIGFDNVVVRIKSVKACGSTYEFLAIRREGEHYGEYSWCSLENIGKDYYYAGDFTARVCGASNKEALAFLNVAKKLIEGLGEIEKRQVEEVQAALNNTADL